MINSRFTQGEHPIRIQLYIFFDLFRIGDWSGLLRLLGQTCYTYIRVSNAIRSCIRVQNIHLYCSDGSVNVWGDDL